MGRIASRIIGIPDRDILRTFKVITDALGTNGSFTVQIGENEPFNITGHTAKLASDPNLEVVRTSQGALIGHASLSLPHSVSVNVQRQEGHALLTVNYPRAPETDQHLPIVAAAKKAFAKYDAVSSIKGVLGPELEEFYARREQALLQLEQLSESIITRTEEYRTQLDAKANELRERITEENRLTRAALDAEFSAKTKDLEDKDAALRERAKELDDRSSRHARRDLRTELKTILKERNTSFTLTRDTEKKRWPIHALFILLLIATGAYSFDVIRDALTTEAVNWQALLRALFGVGSFGATCAFYIRWSDAWARQHAEEEFRLRQLELDVDRASWFVEMAMEWRDEEGAEIPSALVDRLTRGLFERESGAEGTRHPSEDLASALIGASSGLTVNVPGVGELRFDRGGIKRFAKAVEDSE